MPRIAPLPESDAVDKPAQTYGRIKEMLNADSVPEIFLPMGQAPAYLSDFYMNYKKFVHTDGALDRRTKLIVALAVALKEGASAWVDFLTAQIPQADAGGRVVSDIAALVATNATYNTFFKFRDLSGSDLFAGMPVGLRAHAFHGVDFDEKTVELINIAISDLNACKPCVAGHVKKARGLGISDEALLETIQCAAVVYSGIQFTRSANC